MPEVPAWALQALDHDGYLQAYQALAAELHICIVPGTMIKRVPHDVGDEEGSHKLLNIAYFIDDKGEILGHYTKKNVWIPERPYLTGSRHDPHEVIQTPIGKVGMLICWDIAFPEAFRELISKGCEVVIVPCFWGSGDCGEEGMALNPDSEALFLKSTLVSRCFENTCAIVFANAGGAKEDGFVGLSQVTLPITGPVAICEDSDEKVVIGDLDFRVLEVAEESYKIRADLEGEDWHYTYRHQTTSE